MERCDDSGLKQLVTSNDFVDHKRKELLGKAWIESPEYSMMPQTCDLVCFPFGIASWQTVLSLQLADKVGTPEPFSQQVNDCSIEVIDTVPQVAKVGNGITSICNHSIRLLGAFGTLRLQPPQSGGGLREDGAGAGGRLDPSHDVRVP
jgi:hypothetical protein